MKRKKLVGLIIIGALFMGALWYFYLRKAPPTSVADAEAGFNATDSIDEQVYQEAKQLFYTYGGIEMPGWLIELAKQNYNDPSKWANGLYKVNGRITKAGALVKTFAEAYFAFGYLPKQQMDKINYELAQLLHHYTYNPNILSQKYGIQ